MTEASSQRIYRASGDAVFNAMLQAAQALGYSVLQSDPAAKTISFNSGLSWWSWSGQDITANVQEANGQCTVTAEGGLARRGLSTVQVISWGEKRRVIRKFLDRLDTIVR